MYLADLVVGAVMPAILRSGAYRFYFFSHEPNEPPHVHVDRDAASLKIRLDPLVLVRSGGFRPHEINAILILVEQHREKLAEAWHGYFGTTA